MPGFDPRYDPAFQRGYAGPPPELAPPAEPHPQPHPELSPEPEPDPGSAPAASDPEVEAAPSPARMKEIPSQIPNEGDSVGVSPGSPSFGRAIEVTEDEETAEPPARPPAGPTPWLIALAALSVIALASGVSGLVRLAAPLSASTPATTVDQVTGRVALDLLSGPLVIGGGVGLVVALLLLIRIVGRTRSR